MGTSRIALREEHSRDKFKSVQSSTAETSLKKDRGGKK